MVISAYMHIVPLRASSTAYSGPCMDLGTVDLPQDDCRPNTDPALSIWTPESWLMWSLRLAELRVQIHPLSYVSSVEISFNIQAPS
jgi:hypothetical protein